MSDLGDIAPSLFEALAPASAVERRFKYLGGLDWGRPISVCKAADIIAALHSAKEIEAAFSEVPRESMPVVETLAVVGIAQRIARMPLLLDRQAAIEALPEWLQLRTKPHIKRLFTVKPWRHEKQPQGGIQ